MNVLGIIFSYAEQDSLRELTRHRTLASLPMAGRYRMIDFPLSNFVNDGITDVSVIALKNFHSLMDHLGAGREWDLIRKRGGLRVLPPFSRTESERDKLYRGSIDALAGNMHSIRRTLADYVVMTGSNIIYSMNFKALLEQHIESNADITAVYTKDLNGHPTVPSGAMIMHFNDEGRFQELYVNKENVNQPGTAWSTGVFVIKKSLLETLVADAMALGKYHFHEDILRRLSKVLNIQGYEYKGFLLEVSNVTGYMQANMNFLSSAFREAAFQRPIYTKSKDSVPARYFDGCKVTNSIISDGCRIEGTVENSLISRGVRIGKGAVVRNSVVMQNTEIMRGVHLDHVILDKDVIVRENRRLTGHITYPVVIEKASII